MKKYKYLFWDMDGTIINSFCGITRSFAYALEHYGIHITDLNELSPVIGPPLRDSFMDMFGFDESKATEAVAKYRERYINHYLEESELYNDIDHVLKMFYSDGFINVLATSKPEVFARSLMDYHNLSGYFTYMGCASMDKSKDSKIKVLESIISELDINDMSEVVMIGDRKYDLCSASKLGIDAIGVLYGFGSYDELSSCPHIYLAKDVKNLYNYIAD